MMDAVKEMKTEVAYLNLICFLMEHGESKVKNEDDLLEMMGNVEKAYKWLSEEGAMLDRWEEEIISFEYEMCERYADEDKKTFFKAYAGNEWINYYLKSGIDKEEIEKGWRVYEEHREKMNFDKN